MTEPTKILGKTVPLTADQQEQQSWLSRVTVAGGAAPAFSTCIVDVALPDGRTVKAAPNECLGTLSPTGPLQLAEADPMTVKAGATMSVTLTPQAATSLLR